MSNVYVFFDNNLFLRMGKCVENNSAIGIQYRLSLLWKFKPLHMGWSGKNCKRKKCFLRHQVSNKLFKNKLFCQIFQWRINWIFFSFQILVKFFEPSIIQCFVEPWVREMGFIICYGAIILKLYHHLIEFRTRKAHRWVVKDTDLLKYLLIMTFSVFGYMAAFTAFMLNFRQENYDLLVEETITENGSKYQTCKPLLWDFVTETGELIILIFGIHLSYATRNARTQFHVSLHWNFSVKEEF